MMRTFKTLSLSMILDYHLYSNNRNQIIYDNGIRNSDCQNDAKEKRFHHVVISKESFLLHILFDLKSRKSSY